MKNIYLISCSSKKLSKKAKAQDLYASPLFKLSLAYARKMVADEVFILSARYGLVDLRETISPYNQTLNTMTKPEVEKWAKKVIAQLGESADTKNDNFIFLAGEHYVWPLLSDLRHISRPLKGMGIGKRLKYLKEDHG